MSSPVNSAPAAGQVSNYQCPNCTGPLQFSSATGRLECAFCRGSFAPEEIDGFYAARDEKAAKAHAAAKKKKGSGGWDASELNADWGEDGAKLRSYNCPSCGAELICEETTAASSCPYCGNPAMVPGQFGGALRPDYVIPFKLDKDAAVAALKRHYRKKLLLPGKFSENNQIQKLQGVYVPFFLFDARADISCKFDGQKISEHRSGDKIITTVRHHDSKRAGSVEFEKVPTDASQKMADDLMDSILPYRYDALKPFSMAYFAGFLADKYDVEPETCMKRADEECAATAEEAMRQDALKTGRYSRAVTKRADVTYQRGRMWYALLPVWLLHTEWEGKSFLFAMNGQTGKLAGDLPISKKKRRIMMGVLTFLFTLLSYFAMYING